MEYVENFYWIKPMVENFRNRREMDISMRKYFAFIQMKSELSLWVVCVCVGIIAGFSLRRWFLFIYIFLQ